MYRPEDRRDTKNNEWVSLNGDIATSDITEYAQQELGYIVFVEIETTGKSLSAEEVFGTVEAVKTFSDLFLPVSGTIIEKNPVLDTEPEKVNTDPYGDGWMIKMKVDNPDDVTRLMDADAYKKVVA